jgi:hypothetical protein
MPALPTICPAWHRYGHNRISVYTIPYTMLFKKGKKSASRIGHVYTFVVEWDPTQEHPSDTVPVRLYRASPRLSAIRSCADSAARHSNYLTHVVLLHHPAGLGQLGRVPRCYPALVSAYTRSSDDHLLWVIQFAVTPANGRSERMRTFLNGSVITGEETTCSFQGQTTVGRFELPTDKISSIEIVR